MAQIDTQVGDAQQRLGAVAVGVGAQMFADVAQEQQRAAQERKTRDEALARSRAGDGLLDFELQSKTAVEGIKDKVQRGELPYEKAHGELEGVLARVKMPSFGPEQALVADQYSRGAQRLRFQATAAVNQVIDTAQRSELKSTFTAGLDRLGKIALLPDASLEEVLANADKVALSGRAAGIPEADVAKQVQTFKDNTRFQRAQSDLVAARRDMPSLDAFQQRLETGDLSGTLDPDKRIALLKETDTLKFQAQNQQQHALDKREKLAERAVTNATRQIETGLPLTADGWTGLRTTVEGTPYAEDFNRLVKQERDTQQVLRMPMADQQRYIQTREAELQQAGGTLADRANLQRIKATVENNAKQLADEPLVAAQRLFGRAVQPLDPNDLLQPGGAGRAAGIFADRAATLAAMQKQYGSQVGTKPLLPQEAGLLVKAIDSAGPADANQLFGTLRGAINDDDTYRAVMQQIAPDSPVKARAGMLTAIDRPVTIQSNLIASDVRVSSAKVAETMLAGEIILNKTKGQKQVDGQAHSLFVPARQDFSTAFVDSVGNLYRSRPGAQEGDLQAAFAYYVGKSAELGRLASTPKDIDSTLVKEAITATIGDVVDVNGQGKAKAPIGMTGSDMQAKLRERFSEMVKEQDMPPSAVASFEHYGVINYRRDGQYMLTLGGAPVLGKGGAPLVVDLDPPPLSGTRYRRGQQIPGAPEQTYGVQKK
ncbi:hypothetical protein [Variovorax paradoxus]|nr:hypothetical protein [Variovorax paradoxus]